MRNLASIIGPHIAGDLYRDQATLVDEACDENEEGVRRVAAAVTADPNVTNPTAVFLSRIKRGAHKQPSRVQQRRGASALSALDRAELAYHAKIAQYNEHGVLGDQPGQWSQAAAIAYAIDYTRGATDETEDALRERLGLPRYQPAEHPPLTWSDVLKTLAAGKTQPRPANQPAFDSADDIIELAGD